MMPKYVLLISAICISLILFSQSAPDYELTIPSTYKIKPQAQSTKVEFKDVSLDWKINLKHTQTSKQLSALTETLGSGACTFDFNRDGWLDIFFVGGSGHSRHYGRKSWWNKASGNRLLLNIKGKYFKDISEKSGLTERIWGMSCSASDFNNDGFVDLLVTSTGSNQLYKNNGDGKFINITADSGIKGDSWSTGASIADFNKDGLLDIYISNYIRYKKGARTFERTSGFKSTGSVAFDPTLYDPEPNKLYLNNGNFKFQTVTQDSGVSNSLGRSLGANWIDLNKDSWLDLIVINDHSTPNQVFINQKGLKFTRSKERYAPIEIAGAHNLTIADFTNNNANEFFMTRGMGHSPVFLQTITTPPIFPQDKVSNFSDTAWSAGIAQTKLLPFSSWGGISSDFNNDGYLDIYVANGMTSPDIDSHFIAQAQANTLFINKRDGTFRKEAATTSKQTPYSSRGVVSADFNNDGQLELLVSNNNDPLQLFENQAINQHAWLGIDLLSQNTGSEVYGAKVELLTDTTSVKQLFTTNQNFLSQGDPRLHIGLGKAKQIKELIIHWPDTTRSSYKDIKLNQYILINKHDNSVRSMNANLDSTKSISAESISTIPKKTSKHLLEALLITLLKAPPSRVINEINQIWDKENTQLKHRILTHIENNWDLSYLPLVRDALNSKDTQLQLGAIRILRNLEFESSVAWLLPLLRHNNSEVQCAVANTFKHFFDEEEAVTHRKKLAVAPLIKALGAKNPQIKYCSANALASAENKRAILPLVSIITSEVAEPIYVRKAAIRALGLVRDTYAKPYLLAVVNNSESKPEIISTALIALKRLNEPKLDAVFKSFFVPIVSTTPSSLNIINKQYETLRQLLINPEGIVFQKSYLNKILSQLISQNDTFGDNKNINSTQVITSLRAIAAAKTSLQLSNVQTTLDYADVDVQEEAILTLLSINTLEARSILSKALLQTSSPVLFKIAQRAETNIPFFWGQTLNLLTHKAKKRRGYIDELIIISNKLPKIIRSRLVNKLLMHELSTTQQNYLFDLCASGRVDIELSETLLKKFTQPKLDLTFAECFFRMGGISDNEILKLRQRLVLKKVLSDSQLEKHLKTTLLLKSAENDVIIAKTILVDMFDDLEPEVQTTALSIYLKHNLAAKNEDKLWRIMKEHQYPLLLKLKATELLLTLNEDKALNYLRAHLIQHLGAS